MNYVGVICWNTNTVWYHSFALYLFKLISIMCLIIVILLFLIFFLLMMFSYLMEALGGIMAILIIVPLAILFLVILWKIISKTALSGKIFLNRKIFCRRILALGNLYGIRLDEVKFGLGQPASIDFVNSLYTWECGKLMIVLRFNENGRCSCVQEVRNIPYVEFKALDGIQNGIEEMTIQNLVKDCRNEIKYKRNRLNFWLFLTSLATVVVVIVTLIAFIVGPLYCAIATKQVLGFNFGWHEIWPIIFPFLLILLLFFIIRKMRRLHGLKKRIRVQVIRSHYPDCPFNDDEILSYSSN